MVNRASMCDQMVSRIISKVAKRMMAQMKLHASESFDPMSRTKILCSFRLTCDTYGTRDDVAMIPFLFFIKKAVSFALRSQLASNEKARTMELSRTKTTTLTTYSRGINYLLQTYATNENVANAESKLFWVFST